MRSAVLFAACCLFCWSQSGLAANEQGFQVNIKFSKPNVPYWAFQHDRNACLGEASRQGWETTKVLSGIPIMPTYDVPRFGNCMLAKGYRPDPNGFNAATFQHQTDDSYRLLHL